MVRGLQECEMTGRLAGRTALVTGAATAIGRASLLAYAKEGQAPEA